VLTLLWWQLPKSDEVMTCYKLDKDNEIETFYMADDFSESLKLRAFYLHAAITVLLLFADIMESVSIKNQIGVRARMLSFPIFMVQNFLLIDFGFYEQ